MLHREMLIGGHFIGGACDQAVGKVQIYAPYDGKLVGTAAEGGNDEGMAAVAAAYDAFDSYSRSSPAQRGALVARIAKSVQDRAEELSNLLAQEVGKPITWARAEVSRLAITFELAAGFAEASRREELPLGFDPRGKDYLCTIDRFPVGPILCIVPYNWPFNLAAHKIAPALASGNTVVLKPSDLAPLSTLSLARLIHEAGCPPGVLNAVLVPSAVAEKMALDSRIKMVSFTGSPAVGWHLKGLLPEKKVILELGGDASAIVCEDADLDWAIPRLVTGGYGYAGQICIAIQHVLVQGGAYETVRARLIEATNSCPIGDPFNAETVCGPIISKAAADKVMSFIGEAVEKGAKVIAGGRREGNLIWPTLLESVSEVSRLGSEEVFGPVLTLSRFRAIDDAIKRVNRSQYGIQCGVFTRDPSTVERTYRELDVAGVVINDYPTLRFDNYPYGGIKRSGFGREGVKYSMEEMTEPKVLIERR